MKVTSLLISAAALVVLGLGSCRSPEVAQQTGTDFVTDQAGSRPVTYVTPEEYDHMTEAERQRLNASVGVEARWATGKRDARPQPISASELDEAQKAARESK